MEDTLGRRHPGDNGELWETTGKPLDTGKREGAAIPPLGGSQSGTKWET